MHAEDFVVCSTYKTSSVYGDLAKWLARGTIKCVEIYLGLPRKTGYTKFLVPADTAARVDVPVYLKHFCVRFLKVPEGSA
jgi:hypothetical protein